MRVKTIKNLAASENRVIRSGEILEVRYLPDGQFFNFNRPFQVIEGEFTGTILSQDSCVKVEEEKTYTEKQWNELKKHYSVQLKNEREQTAIFQGLARDMANKVKEKNKEIERLNFFLESSSIALMASCEALETLKETKQSR